MFHQNAIEVRLAKDIEIKEGKFGKYIFTSFAYSKSWKDDKGEWQESVVFLPCVVNNEFAIKKLDGVKKGTKMLISYEFTSMKKEGDFETLIIRLEKLVSILPSNSTNSDTVEKKPEINDDNIPF